MKPIARRERLSSGWARILGLGLGVILGLGPVASSPARAARVASDVRRAAGEPKPAVAARANLALLAARIAAARSNSNSGSSASSGSATGTASQPATSPATQFLIPANVADPIMNSKLIKDLEHLIAIRHGKMPNFNQQTLDALQADVGLRSPRNVAPHPARSGAKSKPAAQGLDLSSTGTQHPSPAPVPEPGTMLIFGLGVLALAARSRLGRRPRRA